MERRKNRQRSLFEEMNNEDNSQSEESSGQIPKAFGITKKGLKNASYPVLENIFYGMYNLKIPGEMLKIENPAEILANYYSSGILKRYDAHLNQSQKIPNDFLDLVKYLNKTAWGDLDFAKVSHEFKKRFDSSPGMQRKRLEGLSSIVKTEFVNSFFSPYLPSKREQPNNPKAFYDPNSNGTDKKVYADIIYGGLEYFSNQLKDSK